jgi:hypothetical protein
MKPEFKLSKTSQWICRKISFNYNQEFSTAWSFHIQTIAADAIVLFSMSAFSAPYILCSTVHTDMSFVVHLKLGIKKLCVLNFARSNWRTLEEI